MEKLTVEKVSKLGDYSLMPAGDDFNYYYYYFVFILFLLSNKNVTWVQNIRKMCFYKLN